MTQWVIPRRPVMDGDQGEQIDRGFRCAYCMLWSSRDLGVLTWPM